MKKNEEERRGRRGRRGEGGQEREEKEEREREVRETDFRSFGRPTAGKSSHHNYPDLDNTPTQVCLS